MTAPALELADIFRIHGPTYREAFGDSLSSDQKKALKDISVCRTAALGGHVKQCDRCGHRKFVYRSCRNRNCPKCQAAARASWLEQRGSELLPIEYFHVVFTLPHPMAALALQNPRVVYSILFRAASETLLQIGADPKHLGAEVGFLAVLHTWGQNLHHHPHLHCVVAGGGIAPDRSRWISCRRQFLFPVKVLSRLFRAKFASYLTRAFHQAELRFHGKLEYLGKKKNFLTWLNQITRSEWVVYAKPPFGGPQQVLKLLGPLYPPRGHLQPTTHLPARRPSDLPLEGLFPRKSAPNHEPGVTEFVRRFLLHVLPRGFVKIRHFGFLANRYRQEKIALCRELLATRPKTQPQVPSSHEASAAKQQESESPDYCPVCKVGLMKSVEILFPQASVSARTGCPLPFAILEWDTA